MDACAMRSSRYETVCKCQEVCAALAKEPEKSSSKSLNSSQSPRVGRLYLFQKAIREKTREIEDLQSQAEMLATESARAHSDYSS